MKKNLVQEGQRKSHKRLTRERHNNKMLKRTEKRKTYSSEITWPEAVTSGFFVKQVVFLTVNHRGPLPLRELHSTGETIVWRDPGGSWACLPPLYHCECHHLATGCDTPWVHPVKHTKKRGALSNATKNHKKSWVEEGQRKRPEKRKHSEWKKPYETKSWAEESLKENF